MYVRMTCVFHHFPTEFLSHNQLSDEGLGLRRRPARLLLALTVAAGRLAAALYPQRNFAVLQGRRAKLVHLRHKLRWRGPRPGALACRRSLTQE